MRSLAFLLVLAASGGACQQEVVSTCRGCTHEPPPVVPNIIWSQPGYSGVRPVVDDRALYVLGEHIVYAFDKTTGAPLWTTPLLDGTSFLQGYGTALAAGLLIIGDIDVFGIDPATGTIRWTFSPRLQYPNERSFERLTTDGTTVYIGGVWGNVYAVDAATGAEKWVSHVTTLPDSVVRVFNPVVDRGAVYVAFADQPRGTLRDNGGAAAIDAATGRLLWSQLFPSRFSEITESTDITVTPTRAVAGSLDGYLYGLDRQTGAIIDTISQTVFGFAAGSPQATTFHFATTGDTVLLAATDNGYVTAFDARNLTHELWQVYIYGSPFDLIVDSNKIYVPYGGTLLGEISPATRKLLWDFGPKFSPDAEDFNAAPALDSGHIYLASDRHVYCLTRP
ncbi:MAG TPA: PQQ-binding-like beta-propeller repeat protein [Gemmatimonadaceae bacterium]